MRALVPLCLLVPAVAVAKPGGAAPSPITIAGQLRDAIAAGNVAAVAAHLQAPLRYQDLRFADAACDKSFGRSGTAAAKKLRAFAACLAGDSTLRDAVIVGGVDAPDVAADPDVDATTLFAWTATTGKKQIVHVALYTVEQGEEGGVVGGIITSAPPPPPPPPPPPAPPTIVPPQIVRAARIAGTDNVTPDAATVAAMAKDGKAKVIAVVKPCFDAAGAPTSALLLKSSGYPAYDDALRAALLGWKIKPYTVNGAARPVCTAITFIYSRR